MHAVSINSLDTHLWPASTQTKRAAAVLPGARQLPGSGCGCQVVPARRMLCLERAERLCYDVLILSFMANRAARTVHVRSRLPDWRACINLCCACRVLTEESQQCKQMGVLLNEPAPVACTAPPLSSCQGWRSITILLCWVIFVSRTFARTRVQASQLPLRRHLPPRSATLSLQRLQCMLAG